MINKLEESGCKIEKYKNSIYLEAPKKLKALDIKTMPYPGFPTDMQAQFSALMAKGCGTGVINETVFENRFMHIGELNKMGANISVEGKVAIIKGVEKLDGAIVKATDLRAGAALIISALSDQGQTEIENIFYIDRGYDCIEKKLSSVGCDIRRVNI